MFLGFYIKNLKSVFGGRHRKTDCLPIFFIENDKGRREGILFFWGGGGGDPD